MDSKPRHRGRHPEDRELFAPEQLVVLRTAVFELSWLLERGYSDTAAVALVGNHHQLHKRQRKAVRSSACGDTARAGRAERRQAAEDIAGRDIAIDGFNCVITLEAAMSGGAVLIGRDTAHRDMSSVHGSYRKVSETHRAVTHVAELLAGCKVGSVRWLLDRPVSNSGRLKALIEDAAPPGMPWEVELVFNPDRDLCVDRDVVVSSSDGWVLDHCGAWLDIPGTIISRHVEDAWLLDLGSDSNRL